MMDVFSIISTACKRRDSFLLINAWSTFSRFGIKMNPALYKILFHYLASKLTMPYNVLPLASYKAAAISNIAQPPRVNPLFVFFNGLMHLIFSDLFRLLTRLLKFSVAIFKAARFAIFPVYTIFYLVHFIILHAKKIKSPV